MNGERPGPFLGNRDAPLLGYSVENCHKPHRYHSKRWLPSKWSPRHGLEPAPSAYRADVLPLTPRGRTYGVVVDVSTSPKYGSSLILLGLILAFPVVRFLAYRVIRSETMYLKP